MAWIGIFLIFMDTQEHANRRVWILLLLPPYTRGEKKNIWSELELNPGPLVSQATALTTRPWRLGNRNFKLKMSNKIGSCRIQVFYLAKYRVKISR